MACTAQLNNERYRVTIQYDEPGITRIFDTSSEMSCINSDWLYFYSSYPPFLPSHFHMRKSTVQLDTQFPKFISKLLLAKKKSTHETILAHICVSLERV